MAYRIKFSKLAEADIRIAYECVNQYSSVKAEKWLADAFNEALSLE